MYRNWYTHFTSCEREFRALVTFLSQTDILWDADTVPEGYYFHICLNDEEMDMVTDFIYG